MSGESRAVRHEKELGMGVPFEEMLEFFMGSESEYANGIQSVSDRGTPRFVDSRTGRLAVGKVEGSDNAISIVDKLGCMTGFDVSELEVASMLRRKDDNVNDQLAKSEAFQYSLINDGWIEGLSAMTPDALHFATRAIIKVVPQTFTTQRTYRVAAEEAA